MRPLILVRDTETLLREWRTAHARVACFHATHNRLAIMLSKEGVDEVIYLIAIGCERFQGPFSWQLSDFTVNVESNEKSDEVRRRLADDTAGFELLCSDFTLVKGPPEVFENPFFGFLGVS